MLFGHRAPLWTCALEDQSSGHCLRSISHELRRWYKYYSYSVCVQILTLDASVMCYPPASVCTAGTEEIQRFLCSGKHPTEISSEGRL